jgi:RNA polymerase sigma-70 factor (ECF subfamily)
MADRADRARERRAVDDPTPPASFEDFFHAERDRLFRVLCVIAGSRHEAEDLAQEAFARVWERWDEVGAMTNPTGYLHRTAMNLFRSRFRRATMAAKRVFDTTPPRDDFQVVDDRQVALHALSMLPPRQRAAIVLTDVLRYTAEEASQMLGVRASTVRALHFQARASLRDLREATDD